MDLLCVLLISFTYLSIDLVLLKFTDIKYTYKQVHKVQLSGFSQRKHTHVINTKSRNKTVPAEQPRSPQEPSTRLPPEGSFSLPLNSINLFCLLVFLLLKQSAHIKCMYFFWVWFYLLLWAISHLLPTLSVIGIGYNECQSPAQQMCVSGSYYNQNEVLYADG